jgi:hypothetical protein
MTRDDELRESLLSDDEREDDDEFGLKRGKVRHLAVSIGQFLPSIKSSDSSTWD